MAGYPPFVYPYADDDDEQIERVKNTMPLARVELEHQLLKEQIKELKSDKTRQGHDIQAYKNIIWELKRDKERLTYLVTQRQKRIHKLASENRDLDERARAAEEIVKQVRNVVN